MIGTGFGGDSGLLGIEEWLGGVMARLKPGERVRLSRRIGVIMRRANARRIRANVEPDGSAMEPRKPRKDRHGRNRLKNRRGPMFKKSGQLRNMRLRPGPDDVELSFAPLVSGTAAVHHWGLVDKVDHRLPTSPKVRYPARPLLGFGPEDREAIMEEVLKYLEP